MDASAIGFIKDEEYDDFSRIIKRIVLPIITGIAGITCTVLGVYGVFGLSLGLGLGIPLMLSTIVPGVFALIKRIHRYIKQGHTEEDKEGKNDNNWATCLSITGCLTAVTFSTLALTGVLTWGTAIALAAPLVLVSVPFSFILLITRIISEFKRGELITFGGIGFVQEKTGIEERKNNAIDKFNKSKDRKAGQNNGDLTNEIV